MQKYKKSEKGVNTFSQHYISSQGDKTSDAGTEGFCIQ